MLAMEVGTVWGIACEKLWKAPEKNVHHQGQDWLRNLQDPVQNENMGSVV